MRSEGALAKRRDPVTGVSEFPNIQETPLQLEQPDLLAASYRAATDRLKVARGADGGAMAKALDALKSAKPGGLAEAALAAASAGATFGQIAQTLKGGETRVQALPRASPGRALRGVARRIRCVPEEDRGAAEDLPANLGPIAKHTARATFAKNFFEVGGIETIGNAGFKDAASCAAAFKESGARIAILCSADPIYEEMAEPVAQA